MPTGYPIALVSSLTLPLALVAALKKTNSTYDQIQHQGAKADLTIGFGSQREGSHSITNCPSLRVTEIYAARRFRGALADETLDFEGFPEVLRLRLSASIRSITGAFLGCGVDVILWPFLFCSISRSTFSR